MDKTLKKDQVYHLSVFLYYVDNDNDDNDDEYNDVNGHLMKLDSDKTDQSNEVNVNKPDFWSLVYQLGQG